LSNKDEINYEVKYYNARAILFEAFCFCLPDFLPFTQEATDVGGGGRGKLGWIGKLKKQT